jgi:hypothetical protein
LLLGLLERSDHCFHKSNPLHTVWCFKNEPTRSQSSRLQSGEIDCSNLLYTVRGNLRLLDIHSRSNVIFVLLFERDSAPITFDRGNRHMVLRHNDLVAAAAFLLSRLLVGFDDSRVSEMVLQPL